MNFFKSRGFLVTATALVVGGAVYLLTPKAPPPPKPPDSTANCITMLRDDFANAWLDPGWYNPTSPSHIPSIMFEPSTDGTRISVAAYPVDANCAAVTAKKISMTIGSGCTFPAGLTVGKVRYDFTDEDVDAFGDLISFSYLRLVPQADPTDPTKLGFKVEFVKLKGGGESAVAKGDTKPCPPFCPVAR